MRERKKREGKEGSDRQSHKEEDREGVSGTGEGPLAREGRLYLNIYAGVPRVPIYATAGIRPACLLNEGRFEEPVSISLSLLEWRCRDIVSADYRANTDQSYAGSNSWSLKTTSGVGKHFRTERRQGDVVHGTRRSLGT